MSCPASCHKSCFKPHPDTAYLCPAHALPCSQPCPALLLPYSCPVPVLPLSLPCLTPTMSLLVSLLLPLASVPAMCLPSPALPMLCPTCPIAPVLSMPNPPLVLPRVRNQTPHYALLSAHCSLHGTPALYGRGMTLTTDRTVVRARPATTRINQSQSCQGAGAGQTIQVRALSGQCQAGQKPARLG